MHGSAPWKTEETIVDLPRLLVLSVLLTFKILEACVDFLTPNEFGSCRKRRDFGARGSLVRQAVAARPRWDLAGLGHRQLSKNSGWSGFFLAAFRPAVDFFVGLPRPASAAAPLRRSCSARWRLSSRRRASTSSRKSSGQR